MTRKIGQDNSKLLERKKKAEKLADEFIRILKFYADEDNYAPKEIWDSAGLFVGSNVDYDGGKKARELLSSKIIEDKDREINTYSESTILKSNLCFIQLEGRLINVQRY